MEIVLNGEPRRFAAATTLASLLEAEGLAGRALENPVQQVYEAMWQPRYPEIEVVAPKA